MKKEYLYFKGVKLPFVFERSDDLPLVSLKIVFKASGKVQNASNAGLSRLCAKILEEGSEDLGSEEFAKRLENRAISLSISSGIETLSIDLSSLHESFSYGIKMLSKLLKKPNLNEKTLQKVKEITLGDILRKSSDFDYVASLALQELIYENSSLMYPSIGTKKSIQEIGLKEVKNFLHTHLDLQNAMIIIGGNLNKKEAKKSVKIALKSLQKGKKRKLVFHETSDKEKIKIIKKPSEQAYVYFASPLYMKLGEKDIYKAQVASFILGESGFGSRLMEEIRVKKGLAYSVYGKIAIEHSFSTFLGYLQTKNENRKMALNIVKEVVSEFVKNGAKEEELNQAKRFLLGSEPLRNETLSQRLGRNFSDVYSGYGLGFNKKRLELIEKLSLHELNNFISSCKELTKLSFAIVTNDDI